MWSLRLVRVDLIVLLFVLAGIPWQSVLVGLVTRLLFLLLEILSPASAVTVVIVGFNDVAMNVLKGL